MEPRTCSVLGCRLPNSSMLSLVLRACLCYISLRGPFTHLSSAQQSFLQCVVGWCLVSKACLSYISPIGAFTCLSSAQRSFLQFLVGLVWALGPIKLFFLNLYFFKAYIINWFATQPDLATCFYWAGLAWLIFWLVLGCDNFESVSDVTPTEQSSLLCMKIYIANS